MLNALAGSVIGIHIAIRSLFGVGEAGNFPSSIKTVAEWFPKKERALATGIFNSGSNLGAMLAALFVPWCMVVFGDQLGWKMAFGAPMVLPATKAPLHRTVSQSHAVSQPPSSQGDTPSE